MKSYHIISYHITLHARNATTIILFIVTAKILTAIRSISAETAIINLHPNARGRRGQIAGGSIRLALYAENKFSTSRFYEHYSNYCCSDKKCNHSFLEWKSAAITAPSMSSLFGKHNFKRMRYPIQIIVMALSMFYLGKNSFRNISLILKTAFHIKVSHTTISNWCVKFAPMFDDMRIQLVPLLDLNSDEWHADETVVKVAGVKHYIWFIIDSETRFVIGFHLSPHRDSPQAVSLFSEAAKLGKPSAIVSDRYSAYKVPTKSIFGDAKHIRVQSFKDDISNN